MGAGSWYGDSDEAESIATIHEALDRGVNLIDTGDFYGIGQERAARRQGAARSPRPGAPQREVRRAARAGRRALGYDARPAAVKNFLAHSLSRLGVDHIDIYRPARLDPNVPIEDTVGAIADMVKAGYVRYVGLSECPRRRAARGQGASHLRCPARVRPRQPAA
jgi:aryl-alcohol dehydrogenase-like predicted oxidoreductase